MERSQTHLMNKPSISAVILTHASAEKINQCLESVKWCDEIIIVADTTSKYQISNIKYQKYKSKIKIYERQLKDDFAAQRNFGLSKAKGKWVLFIDSDEQVSDELKKEINERLFVDKVQFSGYFIKRVDYFLGKWLEFGETSHVQLLRLAKNKAGLWKGRVHEVWDVGGSVGKLTNPVLHYPHPTVAAFLHEINRYTDLVAQSWKEEGRRVHAWEIFIFPTLKFLQNYFLNLGFLDAIPGLIIALMMSFHSFLARAKFWHLNKRCASSV